MELSPILSSMGKDKDKENVKNHDLLKKYFIMLEDSLRKIKSLGKTQQDRNKNYPLEIERPRNPKKP